MSYKEIETLCLSSEVTYKEAKKVIEPIYEEWWDKKLKDKGFSQKLFDYPIF